MESIERPDPADYMRLVAASGEGRSYKQAVLRALDVREGHRVLEIGCGPGADLPDLAAATGPTGRVIAVDVDPAMVAAARAAVAGHPVVDVHRGDVHSLDLPAAAVDRVHADRTLQHVAHPPGAVAEIARVLRPGGRAALVEPDWATLAIDADHLDASQAFTDHTCTRVVRNSRIGRQLPRMCTAVGLEVVAVTGFSIVFTDFARADAVLGMTRNTRAGVAAGQLEEEASTAWLADLARGTFTAAVTLLNTVLIAPGRGR